MRVLGIETAGEQGGVALLGEEGPGYVVMFPTGRGQGELLAPAARAVLDLAGVRPRELGLIAVDVGPGSFTGLRIGLAFAKGLAQALGVPVVGVRQTEVVGKPLARWWPGRVAVWVHDRREFVYMAWADAHRAGSEIVLPWPDALARIGDRAGVLLTGSGAVRFGEAVRAQAPGVTVADPLWAWPSPLEVARQGRARFLELGPDDVLRLEPHYVQKEG
ncbi:MAG: tRNA (adenosine(37)-N6)-threonylcarbamoyltransferase complex dimerization subunit type 1 TsaB [Candidatus Acetothermia bacterium]|jgi:tRNA threonylcarbamoyladenosine biosynthesis protein TsaB|nr:tRNA (adenosine(37)-N6)-threonylcarbamoyltransferase complex dimerization subunit type 1 TsaB [Candidatus Acetothermia bacterium]